MRYSPSTLARWQRVLLTLPLKRIGVGMSLELDSLYSAMRSIRCCLSEMCSSNMCYKSLGGARLLSLEQNVSRKRVGVSVVNRTLDRVMM